MTLLDELKEHKELYTTMINKISDLLNCNDCDHYINYFIMGFGSIPNDLTYEITRRKFHLCFDWYLKGILLERQINASKITERCIIKDDIWKVC